MEDVLERITPFLIDHLGKVYQQDEEYRNALEKEYELFERLNDELTDEQQEDFEEYFIAANSTAAILERLVYQQGMKDMLALLKALS